MRLGDVMDEVAGVISELSGLNVHPWPVPTLTPPAGYVSYPQSIDYDQTYGRGEDGMTDLPIVLVAGDPTEKSTRDLVTAWSDGDGPTSLKRAFEAHTWTSCDHVQVVSVEFDIETIGGVPYLCALFKASVTGSGED